MFTCEKLLLDFVGVQDRCGDTSHGADHAAQAEVDEHEKEHDGPKGRSWEMCHGLCEGDEGQAGALHSLWRERRTGDRQVTDRHAVAWTAL